MQGPLQSELTQGVSTFNTDVAKFDLDYDAFGPMTPGLTAREASDRSEYIFLIFSTLISLELQISTQKLKGLDEEGCLRVLIGVEFIPYIHRGTTLIFLGLFC